MTNAIDKQQAYVTQQKAEKTSMDIVVAGAFVRGIRDLGYKDNCKALAELVDNSWEAQATRVDIIYGYPGTKSKAKPEQIAVLDDGHGMLPEMIRHAMRWGGTDREGSVEGFGRFGFGLPASCVSIGKRFTVYSKLEGEPIYKVSVDLDEIEQSTVSYKIPQPSLAEIPDFVREYLGDREWTSGTIVVLDKLDRLKYATAKKLTYDLLLPQLGVTYHNVRHSFKIHVDGEFVKPIDPLFLTEGHGHYDTNELTANSFEPLEISVKDKETGQELGKVKVRFSYLPPNFHFNDIHGDSSSKSNIGPRWPIMEEYHGLIVSRMGRVLAVVNKLSKTRFVNDDRYIKVELDFDASLDDQFGVTTSKQQVSISDRIWTLLEAEGLYSAITNLRREARRLRNDWREKTASGEQKASTSAEVMSKTKELMRPPSEKVMERQKKEGAENLRKPVTKEADETGESSDEVVREIEFQREGRLFDVERFSSLGGYFFSMRVEGGTKVLRINTEHRFYTDVYMGPEATPRLRAALDLLLFAIGDSMEDATNEARCFYKAEIPVWSNKFDIALDSLSQIQNPVDDAEQVEEDAELNSALFEDQEAD